MSGAADFAKCTGLSAAWCPICGDCTCRDENGEVLGDMDDPECPLHQAGSMHAEVKPSCVSCGGTGRDYDCLGEGAQVYAFVEIPCSKCGGKGKQKT